MIRSSLVLFALLASGCPTPTPNDSGADTGGADSADTGDTETGDTETGDTETGDTETGDTETGDTETGDTSDTASECATINPGNDWAWSGACPQMNTPVVIAVSGCALSLDYDAVGGMTMGMPYSATVSGDVVTFADDNSVDGCVGTVESADKITGDCKSGCTFTLRR